MGNSSFVFSGLSYVSRWGEWAGILGDVDGQNRGILTELEAVEICTSFAYARSV